uniref:Uncharacterized protein n=1 Tax=Gasterosteus aculeatus TaxID=69293 RepID=G3P3D9_GASAC
AVPEKLFRGPPTQRLCTRVVSGGGGGGRVIGSSSGKVVLQALGAGLLHLHHHGLHGDLLLLLAAVQLVVLVVGGLLLVLRARGSRHGAEGVGAGGRQGAQERGALRHLLVLVRAAAPLLGVGVALRGDHLLLAHRTRLLG